MWSHTNFAIVISEARGKKYNVKENCHIWVSCGYIHVYLFIYLFIPLGSNQDGHWAVTYHVNDRFNLIYN